MIRKIQLSYLNGKTGLTFALLFAAASVFAADTTGSQVVQTMDSPSQKSFSGKELAQLIEPKNNKTPAISKETPTGNFVADSETSSVLATPSDLKKNPVLTTSSAALQESLISLPALTPEALTTGSRSSIDPLASDLLALPESTSILSDMDSVTSAQEKLKNFYVNPKAKDFLNDLNRLLAPGKKNVKRIGLLNTIYRSLEANQSLKVERLRPEISNTSIESAEGAFDTTVNASVGYGSSRSKGPKDTTIHNRSANYAIGVGGRLPSGTDYSLNYSGSRTGTNSPDLDYANALNLNITQNLLKGAGADVNLISVWTAQNNYVSSLYQLQNNLINLVTDTQKAYWNVYLGLRTLEIRRQAYLVAREQRERTEEFVRVGRSAPLDALASQAEEASRISDIINSVSNLKQSQLTLLRLMNPENLESGWTSLVYPSETPVLPTEKINSDERIRLARYFRPDFRQAEIDLANGELEVYRSQNGLLPQLDFFIDLGLNGSGGNFSSSNRELADADYRNYRFGLQFSQSIQNRVAKAANRRANFQRTLAEEAVRNYCQIIEVDVRTAIIEIERTKRLIFSTEVTEELRRQQLEAETEKYRVGRSTQIEVSQAQRDYVSAQLDRVSAEVANVNAYLELYRVEGTALQRRGIQPVHINPESLVSPK